MHNKMKLSLFLVTAFALNVLAIPAGSSKCTPINEDSEDITNIAGSKKSFLNDQVSIEVENPSAPIEPSSPNGGVIFSVINNFCQAVSIIIHTDSHPNHMVIGVPAGGAIPRGLIPVATAVGTLLHFTVRAVSPQPVSPQMLLQR